MNDVHEHKSSILEKDTPIFAYLRRSTKNKQEVSLENQADNIDLIIKNYKLNKDKVRYFRESLSAFENRRRKEFENMLHEIDKLKTPCAILVRDPSRLSRNPKDSLEIANRLFGDNKVRKSISKIIFFEDGEWDENSDKREVTQVLLNSYHESITTGKRSKNGVNAKLSRGEYIHRNPQGLEKIRIGGVIHLKENGNMPFIRKAFEMKMAGTTHKKISKYLADNGIRKGERTLMEELFSNTIYIGKYTDKTTGQVFENILFFSGKPPISMTLWQGVQNNKGKKKDTYGDKQSLFHLGEILRTTEGRRLSGYFQKGTAQYKNTIEGIHASEKWILEEYLDFLKVSIVKGVLGKKFENVLKKKALKVEIEILQKHIERLVDTFFLNGEHIGVALTKNSLGGKKDLQLRIKINSDDIEGIIERLYEKISTFYGESGGIYGEIAFSLDSIDHSGKEEFFSDLFSLLNWLQRNFEDVLENFQSTITQIFEEKTKGIREERDERINRLELEKKRIEEEDKQAMRAFLKSGGIEGLEQVLNEDKKARKEQIKALEDQIGDIQNNGDYQALLAMIPNILIRTFELSSKVLTEEENRKLKDDIFDLIKLTTFELRINKKKALEIELFQPVRQALFGKNNGMEAPPGVEPGYEALQAPV